MLHLCYDGGGGDDGGGDMLLLQLLTMLLLLAADCGWNVAKAISTFQPAIAIALPTATTTSQHCVVSSSTHASNVSQHCAVTQTSALNRTCQPNDTVAGAAGGAGTQPVTQKLTEQGRLVWCHW